MTVTAVAPRTVGVEVGTVFVRSWGYDQTNVDYYRVVGLTPKGVRVQKWSHATVDDDGGPITHVAPGETPATHTVWPKAEQDELRACRECREQTEHEFGPSSTHTYPARWCEAHGPRTEDVPVETKRLSTYGGEHPSVFIAVGNYNDHAGLWDGRPDYQTGSGWGH